MDDGGEGIKTPPVIENTKTETVSSEQAIPVKDKKFWGLSKWVWFVAGAIVIFAVLTIAIVLAVH